MIICESSCFVFSSRRRHTRCALVTGVQTCALPILARFGFGAAAEVARHRDQARLSLVFEVGRMHLDREAGAVGAHVGDFDDVAVAAAQRVAERSEERRVGKACVSTCRSRWSPYHIKKKNKSLSLYISTSQSN